MKFSAYILGIFSFLGLFSCDNRSGITQDLLHQDNIDPTYATRQLVRITKGDSIMLGITYEGVKPRGIVYNSLNKSTIYDNGNTIYKFDYEDVNTANTENSTQYLTYNSAGVLSEIGETIKVTTTTPANTPIKRYKTLYTITYAGDLPIKIFAKTGEDNFQQAFVYTKYREINLTYTLNNVTQMEIKDGGLNAQEQPLPNQEIVNIKYSDYDDKKSPYSLLPLAIKLHYLTKVNPLAAQVFSYNNPKKITSINPFTGNVVLGESIYTYDNLSYAVFGLGMNYIYREL